ncbi:M50 family metallopeptidase [Streptomyces mirabilis]|uniref:M50 family metallopeptidase n=1 Tax=Streptomyces mirabilis TaxID=68239 RepID=UPI00371F0861
MTAASSLLERRPARHAEIVLGPPLLCGPRILHLVRDRRTGKDYEIGEKEHFVIERLDGSRTLSEIGTEYARRYGRRLEESSWRQLLTLLAQRNLLDGGPVPAREPSPRPAASAASEGRSNRFRGELVFGDPTALLEWVHRRLRFLFSPYFLVPLLAVLAGMEVHLALHARELWHGIGAMYAQPELAMIAFSLLWASTGLHELAHGLTCRHFGGRATEVGMRWNLPMVYMYCQADDFLLFRPRWHRVATASAGVVANLVFLLPFLPLWILLPKGDVTRDSIGAMLLIGSVKAALNYLPLPGLDGYVMLQNALNATRLSAETARYLRLLGRRRRSGKQAALRYPTRARVHHIGFALLLTLVLSALAGSALALLEAEVPDRYHTLAAAGFAAVLAAMAGSSVLRARHARRAAAAATVA